MDKIIGNDKTVNIIRKMIDMNIIPEQGIFEITEKLIDDYFQIYNSVYSDIHETKPAAIRYLRKLVGFSLLKLNSSRIGSVTKSSKQKITKLKFGIVYLISNPAFPGMFKIGMTQDLDKRLNQYQTYDPFKKFKVEHYKIVEDRKLEEKKYKEKFKMNIVNGEWISTNQIKTLFHDI